MPTLNLKIFIPDKNATKTYPLDQSLHVYQICDHVREKENLKDHQAQDWGIFLSDEDPKKGIWLEEARSLEYYLLRDGDQLEYKKKIRPLKVKMMDESIKTVLVDDSQAVSQLMVVICGRIGIANYEEYSLVREPLASETSAYHTGTLSRGSGTKEPLYNTLRGRVSGDGTLNRPVKDGAKDSMSKDERKMESLRRKLHTDDEINWVDNCKTLREQGIEEFEILLLRRKFFYSDQNIDSHDPVQLNLLYVQCRDAIINGTHPVTLEQACKFAGIQCQILYGDHNPLKHKSGFLDLQELIVKDFRKMKGLEKKIYEEHKTFCGSNEIDSKVSYVKLARALKTYGVTFFLVKEKMKGKNRLRPRLLGITKDSVLKLDEQTKEMVQTWPLTRVKRWGATPHSFTLDFGDYQDGYYSVQTADGEKISSLIAGYIDIIMKNRGNKKGGGSNKNGTALESCEVGYNIPYRYDGDEWANMQESLTRGDEESTLIEEIVSPHRATYIKFPSSSPLTGKLNSSTKTAPSGSTYIDNVPGPYIGSRSGRVVFNGPAHPTGRTRFLADPAHKECLERGILRIGTALDKLNNRDNRDTNGKKNQGGDMNEFKIEGERRRRVRFVEDKIARITAGSARIMSLVALPSSDTHEMGVEGAGQEEDFALSLRVAVTDVADSLEGLLKEINVIESETNGMDDENRTTLLNAVKELALATTGLLECLRSDNDLLANQENNSDQHEMNENGEHSDPVRLRIALIASHLNRVGECGALVLTALGDEPNMHDASLNQSNENGIRELMGCAKGVANAAAHLVLRAKHIANEVGSEGETRERIVGAATHCALKTSQLITCVKVMAPTIHNEVCKTQTIQSAQAVTQSVNHVLMIAQESTDNQKLLTDLNQAASQVLCALDRLIENVTKGFEPERDARNTSPPDISDLMLERKEIQAFSNIRSATEILLNSLSKQNTANRTGTDEDNAINTNLMIQQARIVAQATADLVSAIKLEAHKFDQGSPSGNAEDETENNKRKKSLFDSAKRLAEATTKLVECAKFFSSSDQKNDISKEIQAEKFAEAAVNLRYATKNALDTISSNRIIKEFRSAARKSISSANDVLNVTKHLIASDSLDLANNVDANKNLYAYDFISHCKLVGDRLTDLIRSVEVCDVSHNGKHPEKSCSPDSNKFSRVIQTCDECLIPAQQLLHQTDRVEDSGSIPGRVNYFVRDLTKSLSRLKTCSHKVQSQIQNNTGFDVYGLLVKEWNRSASIKSLF